MTRGIHYILLMCVCVLLSEFYSDLEAMGSTRGIGVMHCIVLNEIN